MEQGIKVELTLGQLNHIWLAFSTLSDVQEMVERGYDKEDINKILNHSKQHLDAGLFAFLDPEQMSVVMTGGPVICPLVP